MSLLPFLCTGVTSANFKEEEKFEDLVALFKSANISIFPLTILVGISFFYEALDLPNLRISFSTSPLFTSSRWNVLFLLGFFFFFFLNCKNARVIFIFQNGFESWILNVSGNWTDWIKFRNIKLLYYIRKEIRILCFFTFSFEPLFILSRVYFLSGYWLVREQRFYCFPNFLIIYNIFLIQTLLISFFRVFSRETYIYSFVLHKACRFLLFSSVKSCFSASTFYYFSWGSFCYKKHLVGSNKLTFNRSKTI